MLIEEDQILVFLEGHLRVCDSVGVGQESEPATVIKNRQSEFITDGIAYKIGNGWDLGFPAKLANFQSTARIDQASDSTDPVTVVVEGILIGEDHTVRNAVDHARTQQGGGLSLLKEIRCRIGIFSSRCVRAAKLAGHQSSGQFGERPCSTIVITKLGDIGIQCSTSADHGLLMAGPAGIRVHVRGSQAFKLAPVLVEDLATANPLLQFHICQDTIRSTPISHGGNGGIVIDDLCHGRGHQYERKEKEQRWSKYGFHYSASRNRITASCSAAGNAS